jgi:hypothetical protein
MFGPAFAKVCAYFPDPLKMVKRGTKYAKRASTAVASPAADE